jgi:hypothetical protein
MGEVSEGSNGAPSFGESPGPLPLSSAVGSCGCGRCGSGRCRLWGRGYVLLQLHLLVVAVLWLPIVDASMRKYTRMMHAVCSFHCSDIQRKSSWSN